MRCMRLTGGLGVVLLAIALAAAPTIAIAASGQERAVEAGRELLGEPAPALDLKTLEGKRIDLGALYGRRPVYLKFWATWCVPCRQQMPHFEHTFETRAQDIEVIAVDTGFNETREDVLAYRARLGLKMPMVIDDGSLARAFNLRVTPQHVVIGRDGRVLYVGHLADDALERALASAIAEAPTAGPGRAAPSPASSDAAPATLRTLEGEDFPLRDPAGRRGSVIVFLSPWCEDYLAKSRPQRASACRSAREQTERLLHRSSARWIGVASGLWADRDDLLEYRAAKHVHLPLTLDESGALFRHFNVTQVPTLVVLDAGGSDRGRIELPGASNDIAAALARLER